MMDLQLGAARDPGPNAIGNSTCNAVCSKLEFSVYFFAERRRNKRKTCNLGVGAICRLPGKRNSDR